MSSKSNSTASNGSAATATAGTATPKYEARLCHVVKRPDFDGYGFNLHAEKGRPGQYIGKVDDGSPAESSGLRQGDRIIEVNGQNITTETHKKVVELIKGVPNETRLLVIDPRADANDLKAALAKVALAVGNGTPDGNDQTNNNHVVVGNGASNGHHVQNGANGKKHSKDETAPVGGEKMNKANGNGAAVVNNNHTNSHNNNNNNHSHTNGNGTTLAPEPQTTMEKIIDDTKKVLTVTDGAVAGKMALNGTTPATEPTAKTVPVEGKKLNLTMTAAEMRAQLAARKKYDPKSEVCDLRKKYDIIQKM